jgi:hypothetical protein
MRFLYRRTSNGRVECDANTTNVIVSDSRHLPSTPSAMLVIPIILRHRIWVLIVDVETCVRILLKEGDNKEVVRNKIDRGG